MIFFRLLLLSQLALPLAAIDLDLTIYDPWDDSNIEPGLRARTLHKQLINETASANTTDELTFTTTTTSIAGQRITRSIPVLKGIQVEGADGVLDETHTRANFAVTDFSASEGAFLLAPPEAFGAAQPFAQKQTLQSPAHEAGAKGIFAQSPPKAHFAYTDFPAPNADFLLTPPEALEEALRIAPNSTMQNPYVERIEGSYEKIWLMHFDELRPAYKTRLPQLSIYDLKDIYVDAENGEVLKVEDSAMFFDADAHLYVYSPNAQKLELRDLKQVKLIDLNKVEENGQLSGDFVSVRSCCQQFVCPEKDECNDKTKRCVLPGHPKARQNREIIELPTDSLGLNPMMTLPEKITVNTVRCTYVPQARASMKGSRNGNLGFYEKPLDEPGPASEMDQFSEVQAYFSVSNFFRHMRTLLNDPSWCLRSTAMSCNKDGTPVKDDDGNVKNPYKVFVNQVIPDMKLQNKNGSDPESFVMQLMAGKGTSANPVVLNSFTRNGNAAFIPALNTMRENAPRADEILSDLIKPYDHNVFFQGVRDFAYDGDVVFHEFMHAITTSLVNKLNTNGINKWGIHSDPGSLNEGWSDYFSAAFTNRSTIGGYAAVKDAYGEASLRNIKNNLSCPENVIGEIHNDGQVWSGALWEIREAVAAKMGDKGALDFDRAVLASLAQAKQTEDFKTQSAKLLNNINNRPSLGPEIATLADGVLTKRGVKDCFRAYRLSSVDANNQVKTQAKNLLFVPSKLQIKLENYAPASSQLEIGVPAGAKSITLSWRQFLGANGALLGQEARPDKTQNIIPLGAVVSSGYPIEWSFRRAKDQEGNVKKTGPIFAIPHQNGNEITDAPTQASFQNEAWHLKTDMSANPCGQKTIFVSLLSNDFKYVLEDIKVNFEMDPNFTNADCQFLGATAAAPGLQKPVSCSSASPLFSCFSLFLLLGLRRLGSRKKND